MAEIDLDVAAGLIVALRPEFEARGLTIAPPTWMDLDAPWPPPLETDRARIARPRSLGVRLGGPEDAEGLIVLYAGGWADADYLFPGGDVVTSEYVELDDAAGFGVLFRRVCLGVLGGQPPRG